MKSTPESFQRFFKELAESGRKDAAVTIQTLIPEELFHSIYGSLASSPDFSRFLLMAYLCYTSKEKENVAEATLDVFALCFAMGAKYAEGSRY